MEGIVTFRKRRQWNEIGTYLECVKTTLQKGETNRMIKRKPSDELERQRFHFTVKPRRLSNVDRKQGERLCKPNINLETSVTIRTYRGLLYNGRTPSTKPEK